jgi:PIN domain nuclease of toxin-antitoxin system
MIGLLDTNALLWSAFLPDKLSRAASETFRNAETLRFSIVSLWEIGLKLSRGGYHDMELPGHWETMIPEGCREQGIQILSIAPADCRLIQDMPFHHRDPFDRMLAAQAIRIRATILTPDKIFDDYGIRRVW